MMFRACAAFSDLDFSSDDSSSSKEDDKFKRKRGDFTGFCLIDKSSRHISDSDVSDNLSSDGPSLRVVELENTLCKQDKLLCMIFHENKKLNLKLESASSEVASLLDGARLELIELKTRSTLLGACITCPLLISDLEASTVEIKNLKHKLDHSSRYTILSPLCVFLKGKLFYATKENIKLQQEVAYLTAHIEKIVLSEKMIE
jgi:hypothetical protein